MSFLAPLFLIGTIALALPVIFHLIRRTTRERTVFSSLMFLAPSPPRLTRRSRLEHLLLLALRCLVLLLLAIGFARPFLKKPTASEPATGQARRLIVVIDASASMRRGNLWPEAIQRAREILRKTGPADEASVCLFGRRLETLIGFDEWHAAAAGQRAALAELKLKQASPGWEATDVGHALLSAAELLEDAAGKSPGLTRQIVLISDLQEGSHLQSLQGYEWPNGIRLAIEPIQASRKNNAALHLVTDPDQAALAEPGSVRLRVSNDRASRAEQFKVGWAQPDGSFAAEPVTAYVPAGQSRILNLKPVTNRVAELNSIILKGDDEPFDNTVYSAPLELQRPKLLYLGKDSANDPQQPGYYVRRAFQNTPRTSVDLIFRPQQGSLSESSFQQAAFYIADSLSAGEAAAARSQVANGKMLLFVLRTNQAAAAGLAELLQTGPLELEEIKPQTYAMLGEIDFRHPLFAPFADPRYSDFTRIYFWRYRRVALSAIPGARALAKFDTGDPAIFEVPIGKGRVVVFTSGWQQEDSQLALSTKFVPLLSAMLEQATPPVLPVQYLVGDAIPLAGRGPADQPLNTVTAPGGQPVSLTPGQTNFSAAQAPGIYLLTSGSQTQRVAVNLDPAESRLTPLASDEFERLGAPLAALSAAGVAPKQTARTVRLKNAELESRQKLWRWLILGALGFIVAETWLAGRTARALPAQPANKAAPAA